MSLSKRKIPFDTSNQQALCVCVCVLENEVAHFICSSFSNQCQYLSHERSLRNKFHSMFRLCASHVILMCIEAKMAPKDE